MPAETARHTYNTQLVRIRRGENRISWPTRHVYRRSGENRCPQRHLRPYPSIDAVFEALLHHDIDRGLVPIENVIQGPVTETLDNLYRYAEAITIVDMLILPIQHAIGVLSPPRASRVSCPRIRR